MLRTSRSLANAVDDVAQILLDAGVTLTEQACEAIARYGINTVPVVIHQRIDYVHAYTAGLAATELAPRSKAARELDALFAWITQGALL